MQNKFTRKPAQADQVTLRPSVEKPWMKYYPEEFRNFKYEPMTLRDFLCKHNRGHRAPVVEYYGQTFSLRSLLVRADEVAASMAALGVKEGSKIVSLIRATPEFIFILLAAEKLGATLVCRDNSDEENLECIVHADAKIAFIPDYLPSATEKMFYDGSDLEHLILVSPYTYANAAQIPDYIENNIQALYGEETANDSKSIAWNDFLKLGVNVKVKEAPANPHRSLYHSYTSGATGASKEVMHSAATIGGFMSQLVIPGGGGDQARLSVLHSMLPPALVAVVNPMILYNIAVGNFLILDPFCEWEDLDLEFMRYEPNQLIAVPMMAEAITKSTRIPEDYSMDFLYVIGGGADPVHNKWLDNTQAFLRKHHSPAVFSMCYGLSEAGSGAANPHGASNFYNCGSGIPMRGTLISIFSLDGTEELPYGEIGEICVHGPGLMMGYSDPEATAQAMRVHGDGLRWFHTGDYGYMNENGELFTLSRGLNERFGGGYLFTTVMENKVCDIEGVEDCFFVMVPDKDHEGYIAPYLFVVFEQDADVEVVPTLIRNALLPHEQPVRIQSVKKREFYHFKTNRKIIAARIMESQK